VLERVENIPEVLPKTGHGGQSKNGVNKSCPKIMGKKL
jgi:hypothetical protein